MEYRIFNATFNPETDLGLTAISFVDEPAIEQDFVYYSKDGKSHKTNIKQGQIIMSNAEKREVISPLLIPNQLILRVDENGEKYYLRWSKETIAQVAAYFKLNGFVNNFTRMHSWFEKMDGNYEDSFVKDIYLKKLWIIDDPQTDESKQYGYHLPEGTLMCKIKIHNRQIWKEIKEGTLKGLSIEAFLPSTFSGTIKYKKDNNMTNKFSKLKDAFDKFLVAYNAIVDEADALADIAEVDETESGEVSLKYYTSDTDFIEVKSDGTCVASDGNTVEDGEYSLTDGSVLVVEDGKFKETKTVEKAEEEPVEAPIAEEKEEETEEVEKTEEETVEEEDKKEEETQEEVEVEAPYTLVPFEIDGVEFMIPTEVADYIKSLEDGLSSAETVSENFKKEIVQLKERIPSAKPVQTVVKQSKEEKDETPSFASLINTLNKKF